MNLLKHMALAGVAAFAVAASSANAGTLKLDFQGVGPGQSINYSKNSGSNFSGTTAGIFNWTVVGAGTTQPGFSDGQTVKSFCIELGQVVADPTTFDCVDIQNAPNFSPPGPMGAARAALLGDLFARFYSTVMSGPTNTNAAAFQLCVWEITHEEGWENSGAANTSGTDLANLTAIKNNLTVANTGTVGDANVNTFRVSTSGSARDLANTWLGSLLAGGLQSSHLIGLTASSNQDQVIIVPVPAPALLAGLGLVGALVLRRRMKA